VWTGTGEAPVPRGLVTDLTEALVAEALVLQRRSEPRGGPETGPAAGVGPMNTPAATGGAMCGVGGGSTGGSGADGGTPGAHRRRVSFDVAVV